MTRSKQQNRSFRFCRTCLLHIIGDKEKKIPYLKASDAKDKKSEKKKYRNIGGKEKKEERKEKKPRTLKIGKYLRVGFYVGTGIFLEEQESKVFGNFPSKKRK